MKKYKSFINNLIEEAAIEEKKDVEDLYQRRRANSEKILDLMWSRFGPLQGDIIQIEGTQPQISFRGKESDIPGSIYIDLRLAEWDDLEAAQAVALKAYALDIGNAKIREETTVDASGEQIAVPIYAPYARRIGITYGSQNSDSVNLDEDWHNKNTGIEDLVQIFVNARVKYAAIIESKAEAARRKEAEEKLKRKRRINELCAKLDFADDRWRATDIKTAEKARDELIQLDRDLKTTFQRMFHAWETAFNQMTAEIERKENLYGQFILDYIEYLRAYEKVYALNAEIAEHLQEVYETEIGLFKLEYQVMASDGDDGIIPEMRYAMVANSIPDEDGFYTAVDKYNGTREKKKYFNVVSISGPEYYQTRKGLYFARYQDPKSFESNGNWSIKIYCLPEDLENVERAYKNSMIAYPEKPNAEDYELSTDEYGKAVYQAEEIFYQEAQE